MSYFDQWKERLGQMPPLLQSFAQQLQPTFRLRPRWRSKENPDVLRLRRTVFLNIRHTVQNEGEFLTKTQEMEHALTELWPMMAATLELSSLNFRDAVHQQADAYIKKTYTQVLTGEHVFSRHLFSQQAWEKEVAKYGEAVDWKTHRDKHYYVMLALNMLVTLYDNDPARREMRCYGIFTLFRPSHLSGLGVDRAVHTDPPKYDWFWV